MRQASEKMEVRPTNDLRRGPRTQLKTILNRVKKFKSFVYGTIRWVGRLQRRRLMWVSISGCGNRRSGCDVATARRLEFTPMGCIKALFRSASRRADSSACNRLPLRAEKRNKDGIDSIIIRNDMYYPPLNVPAGPAKAVVRARGEALEIHSYKPSGVAVKGVLFLFDGIHRNAAGIRDKAISVADRYGLILLAPLLDKINFPKWRYNYGGVVSEAGLRQPSAWTCRIVQALINVTLEQIEVDCAQVYLFGHSAGAQLMSRICAYSSLSSVNRVIVANPSSYVVPLIDVPVPFGFKNIYNGGEALPKLKSYLAAPMIIYLGVDDTQELYLSRSKYPMQQGRNRYERGVNLYRLGSDIAQIHNCKFNWRLVEVPGVGHSSREMLESEKFAFALGIR